MSNLIDCLPEDSWQVFWHQYGTLVITDTLLCCFPKAVFHITEEATSHHPRSNDPSFLRSPQAGQRGAEQSWVEKEFKTNDRDHLYHGKTHWSSGLLSKFATFY